MKLTNLRALIAAIEEGSLRAGGKRLGVSQPALTKLIRELERELSTTLLVRSTTGVIATAQGLVMYERAVAAERELTQAVEQVRQLDGNMSGVLNIGAVPLAVMLLIPETLRTFGSAFPAIQLRIVEELYIAQLTRLRKGEVDIALGPLPPELPPGEFVVEKLMPIAMVAVARKGSPMGQARCLRDLAEAPWVYTGHVGCGLRKDLVRPARPSTPTGRGYCQFNAWPTVYRCKRKVRRPVAKANRRPSHGHATFDVIKLEEGPLIAELCVLTRTETHLKPSVRHFMAHLHRAAHQIAEQ